MGCYESTAAVDVAAVKKKIVVQDDFTKAELSEIKRQSMMDGTCIVLCHSTDIKYINTRVPKEMARGVYEVNHNGITRLDEEIL